MVMYLARTQLDCVNSLHPGYLLARDDNDCVIKLKEVLAKTIDDEIPELKELNYKLHHILHQLKSDYSIESGLLELEELEKEFLHYESCKMKIIRNIFLIRQVNLKISRYIKDQYFCSSVMAPVIPVPLKEVNDQIAEQLKNLIEQVDINIGY